MKLIRTKGGWSYLTLPDGEESDAFYSKDWNEVWDKHGDEVLEMLGFEIDDDQMS